MTGDTSGAGTADFSRFLVGIVVFNF